MEVFTVILVVAAGLLAVTGFGWLLHRFCVRLEEAGYLHYRKSSGSGSCGNALQELDLLTRPSVVHVLEVQDDAKQHEASIGGK